MSITCPTPVRIWKVGLRGRNKDTDRLYEWRIEASQSIGLDWDTIFTSPTNPIATRLYIDNVYREFLIDSVGKISDV